MKNENKSAARRHRPGSLESAKFEGRRPAYVSYLSQVKEMGYEFEDFLHYFPAFVGHMTLSRMLVLYESYKAVLGVSGHIADVGMFRGASALLFAKLVQIFEPNSLTQVHGFDWFEGNQPDSWEKHIIPGGGKESYSRVMQLVNAQELGHVMKVHKMDLLTELEGFFDANSHIKFKLIFMDAGMYQVVKSALPHFWNRLTSGGRIIFDQYNFDVAPGETKAVDEYFAAKPCKMRTFPFGWMPTAYIDKE